MDTDQDRQNVDPDLDPNRIALKEILENVNFEKKFSNPLEMHENYSACLELNNCVLISSNVICHHNIGLNARKPVFGDLRTTKAQTSLRSLISAFVIHLIESIISKLASSEISIF